MDKTLYLKWSGNTKWTKERFCIKQRRRLLKHSAFNIKDEQNASYLIHLEYSLLIARIKKAQEKNFREQLLDKKMHGIFHRNVEDLSISYMLTFAFLKSPGLYPLNAPREIESIVENEKYRIYWNFIFSTIVSVAHSRPNVVLLDFEKRTVFVVEFSASADKNIIAKENEKKKRCKDLTRELRRLYPEYSVKLIVLIIGALGSAKVSLGNSLKSIPTC